MAALQCTISYSLKSLNHGVTKNAFVPCTETQQRVKMLEHTFMNILRPVCFHIFTTYTLCKAHTNDVVYLTASRKHTMQTRKAAKAHRLV